MTNDLARLNAVKVAKVVQSDFSPPAKYLKIRANQRSSTHIEIAKLNKHAVIDSGGKQTLKDGRRHQ
jgi:hypothetical protein